MRNRRRSGASTSIKNHVISYLFSTGGGGGTIFKTRDRLVDRGWRGESFPGPHDVWGARHRSKILKMVFQMAYL